MDFSYFIGLLGPPLSPIHSVWIHTTFNPALSSSSWLSNSHSGFFHGDALVMVVFMSPFPHSPAHSWWWIPGGLTLECQSTSSE